MSARALPPDPLLVGANRSSDILKAVPTEFVAKCVGEHERHHRLADYARGWDGAGVGSLTHRLTEAAVEALLPGNVRAESRQQPKRPDFEHPTKRLVLLSQTVDLSDHLLARLGIEAARRRLVDRVEVLRSEIVTARCLNRGDLQHV